MRPCLNPASVLYPERDEPGTDCPEAPRSHGREDWRPMMVQTKRRPRGWDAPVIILNP